MIARILVVFFIFLLGVAVLLLPRTNFMNLTKNLKANVIKQSPIINPASPNKIKNYQPAPQTSTESIEIIDAQTGTILYEKNANLRLLPASTTKMMTALVALQNCSPQNVITVKSVQQDGTQMGLTVGDQVTVENLLYGLLLSSGNDAAYVLANSCAISYKDFIKSMNIKAEELKMTNTHFVNPAGFDDNLHYSTAADLAKLAKVVVADPLIAKIVSTKSAVVTDITTNKTYFLQNVNKLLGQVDGVEGVKTGQTDGSLEILVTKTTRNGNSIIISLMGSQDRFKDTQKLIDWVFINYNWNKS